jgi:hypothetical protein
LQSNRGKGRGIQGVVLWDMPLRSSHGQEWMGRYSIPSYPWVRISLLSSLCVCFHLNWLLCLGGS